MLKNRILKPSNAPKLFIMKKLLLLCAMLFSCYGYSQTKKTDQILAEGKLLYRLEKGSWYGTDDFLSRLAPKKDSIGGYVSYEGSDKEIYTVFFNKYNPETILVRYRFDSLPTPKPSNIDTLNKKATPLEKDLLALSQHAKQITSQNTADFFSFYQNTSLNFIPIITKNERKVYVLTGPQITNVVILGNDYILQFNKNNQLKNKTKIHNAILQFPYKSEDRDNPIETTIHSHLVDDYISPTDICTLLLYRDYVTWKQHIVISKNEVSIFDMEKESLFTMKKKHWDKMNQHSGL